MPYYFLCDCHNSSKNIYAKFYEKILNHFQEEEKNTQNNPAKNSK